MTRINLWLAFLVFLSVFSLGHLKHGSIDAIQRLHLTRSLIFNRSVVTERYGPIKFSPLQSIVMIPPYLLGYAVGRDIGNEDEPAHRVAYRFTAFFYNPIITALICVVYFNILVKCNIHLHIALFSTYLLLFATLLLPYSRIMFSEPLSALLIITSFYLLFTSQQETFTWNSVLNFLIISLLSLNNIIFIIFYIMLFGFTIWNTCRFDMSQKLWIIVVSGFLVFLSIIYVWLSYNYARYASPFVFGYTNEGFTNPLLIGLYGLSFSIGRGIIFYSPLTVLGAIYFLLYYHELEQHFRDTLFFFIFSALLYLVIFGKWHSFEGGWSWGPRFLVPFIPIFHIMIPFIVNYYRRRNYLTKWCLAIVLGYALLINAYEFLGV